MNPKVLSCAAVKKTKENLKLILFRRKSIFSNSHEMIFTAFSFFVSDNDAVVSDVSLQRWTNVQGASIIWTCLTFYISLEPI